jgi:hypothetical protein
MEIEIVPEHKPEPVFLQKIVSPDFPVSEVFFDSGIIIIPGRFRIVIYTVFTN